MNLFKRKKRSATAMTSMQEEKRYRAIVDYDYDAEDDTTMTIREGQIITVIGDATAEGWYFAETSSGKQGYVTPFQLPEGIGVRRHALVVGGMTSTCRRI